MYTFTKYFFEQNEHHLFLYLSSITTISLKTANGDVNTIRIVNSENSACKHTKIKQYKHE